MLFFGDICHKKVVLLILKASLTDKAFWLISLCLFFKPPQLGRGFLDIFSAQNDGPAIGYLNGLI